MIPTFTAGGPFGRPHGARVQVAKYAKHLGQSCPIHSDLRVWARCLGSGSLGEKWI